MGAREGGGGEQVAAGAVMQPVVDGEAEEGVRVKRGAQGAAGARAEEMETAAEAMVELVVRVAAEVLPVKRAYMDKQSMGGEWCALVKIAAVERGVGGHAITSNLHAGMHRRASPPRTPPWPLSAGQAAMRHAMLM
jgi:hypothetical protein